MIVNNLPTTVGDDDKTFYPDLLKKISNLFGLYGNVIRIKILFKNRKNALV